MERSFLDKGLPGSLKKKKQYMTTEMCLALIYWCDKNEIEDTLYLKTI